MIHFTLYDELNVQVNSNNIDHLRGLYEHLSFYKSGFKFMNSYKVGRWDGKINLMDKVKRTIPFGLLTKAIRYFKKNFPEEEIKLTPEVKELYQGISDIQEEELNTLCFEPYYFQKDAIEKSLNNSKCILKLPTSSGKCTREIELEIEIDEETYIKYFSDFSELPSDG